ncbi:hypothetical protein GW17_00022116 [Ensete ventricosum]|nr:hypothetical protein GW17_00022116 [Ensete ventricosum]RZR97247.1 hypothetical protein BHM03_00026384 [Ensete ventricosum]
MFPQVLKEAEFVYTVDMDIKKLLNLEPRTWDFVARLEPKLGVAEYMSTAKQPTDLVSILHDSRQVQDEVVQEDMFETQNKSSNKVLTKRPKIAVIGSGPSGLFASLVLGELGAEVTLIERGQAVEKRGRDIGALVVRRVLQSESNFCFGEVGLRIEHPQELINRIQVIWFYSALATEVCNGRGRVPVADYKVVKYVSGDHDGATGMGDSSRSCYSFCMCPGGQVNLVLLSA